MPMWILGHSVVVEGDHLICMVGGAKALAAALNKKTGETVLEYPPAAGNAQTGYMTPYFFDFEGTRVLAMMSDVTVEGYDAKTAKKLFSFPWKNQRTTNVTAPIYRDGHLFVSSGYGYGSEGYKLTKNSDGTIKAEKLWHTEPFDNHHHGLVLIGDHVYGTSSRGNWFAVNFLTGEIGFTARPVAEQTAIHYADGLIYCLTQDSGTVILWDPKPNEFVEVSRFVLPEGTGKAWAHPVVIGGRLYLRYAETLYCYDVKGE
jgi:outer membrane protein assembly factor BamB